MLEGVTELLALQQIDSRLLELQGRLDQVAPRRSAAAGELAESQSRVQRAVDALREAELAQRQAEAALTDREAQVRRLEGQQHQIKTNDAYTALLHEIDAARAAISELETGILEAIERVETCAAAQQREQGAAAAVAQRVGAAQAAIDREEAGLSAQRDELAAQRSTASARVPAALLEIYERVRARRQPAVVAVQGDLCLGCRVNIPPQLAQELVRAQQIVSCGNCRRILVRAEEIPPAHIRS